jgi:hypothetical protein
MNTERWIAVNGKLSVWPSEGNNLRIIEVNLMNILDAERLQLSNVGRNVLRLGLNIVFAGSWRDFCALMAFVQ